MKVNQIILLINTILFSLAFLPAVAFALFSPMVFDAPGSNQNLGIVIYFWSILTFPVVVLVSLGSAWWLHRQGYGWWGVGISFLPWINTVLLIVAFKKLGMVL